MLAIWFSVSEQNNTLISVVGKRLSFICLYIIKVHQTRLIALSSQKAHTKLYSRKPLNSSNFPISKLFFTHSILHFTYTRSINKRKKQLNICFDLIYNNDFLLKKRNHYSDNYSAIFDLMTYSKRREGYNKNSERRKYRFN